MDVPVSTPQPPAPPAELLLPADDEEESGDSIPEIIDAVGRNHKEIVTVVRAFGEEFTKARNANVGTSRAIAAMFFVFLLVVVLGAGYLVYTGHMNDGALTFLLGVIVGYMMKFLDKLRFA